MMILEGLIQEDENAVQTISPEPLPPLPVPLRFRYQPDPSPPRPQTPPGLDSNGRRKWFHTQWRREAIASGELEEEEEVTEENQEEMEKRRKKEQEVQRRRNEEQMKKEAKEEAMNMGKERDEEMKKQSPLYSPPFDSPPLFTPPPTFSSTTPSPLPFEFSSSTLSPLAAALLSPLITLPKPKRPMLSAAPPEYYQSEAYYQSQEYQEEHPSASSRGKGSSKYHVGRKAPPPSPNGTLLGRTRHVGPPPSVSDVTQEATPHMTRHGAKAHVSDSVGSGMGKQWRSNSLRRRDPEAKKRDNANKNRRRKVRRIKRREQKAPDPHKYWTPAGLRSSDSEYEYYSYYSYSYSETDSQ
jgi:hypothetical protein